MPNPVLRDNGVFYVWITVPSDISNEAKGTSVVIPIGEGTTTTKVGTHAKASLRTKERTVARQRFPAALAAVEAHWESLRCGPIELNHKKALALAGEVRQAFMEAFDDDPGDPEMWEGVLKFNQQAQAGIPVLIAIRSTMVSNILMIVPLQTTVNA